MKQLFFIILILFAVNATASSLPNCPSDQSKRYHNCFGKINYNSGEKYIGEWKDDIKHGQGTNTWANGSKYIGEYKDDIRHGQGTYTWASGNKYIGEYKDTKRYGQGTFTWANGDKYIGEYKDNKRHGQGTYTYVSGREERGYHMNGEHVPIICENMGLSKGTESFGQCVIRLIDKVNEGD